MPTIMRIGPFRLYFYSHEPNEPPHIHVDKDFATIKIWLDQVEVAKSQGFKAHEIGAIIAMVEGHRLALLEAWHEYFG
jgi:hypothetical protein